MPPLPKDKAVALIKLRHAEREEHQRRWRFLQDSLEGGNRYRYADYVADALSDTSRQLWHDRAAGGSGDAGGINSWRDPTTGVVRQVFYGVIAERNLIPHVSETSPDGAMVYAMRLERTPVPTNVSRAIRTHLSRIFSHEVKREGPKAIQDWWEDVDGAGTCIDKWVRKTVGPLLLVLGQLDILCDHPPAPAGAIIRSKADQDRYKLGGCVASYILPENMLWWELSRPAREYVQCLVFERTPLGPIFRHWTADESNAYKPDGEWVAELSAVHPYGRVPIVRVFDDRKARCENVGQSRYESVAELQREIYNKKSELILGDVNQSHATLSGPEDFINEGGQLTVGPIGILPKKKDPGTGTYEGWEYVDPPKGAQHEVRLHVQDDSDEADREACLLKPAGQATGSTVSQSGISKQMDHDEGNDYLSELAETLADAETCFARLALLVTSDGRVKPADLDAIEVEYPKEFDLYSLDDLMAFLTSLQGVTAAGGDLPTIEAEAVKRAIRQVFPGMSDETARGFDDEIDAFFAAKAEEREQMAEMRTMMPPPGQDGQVPAPGTVDDMAVPTGVVVPGPA